MPNQKRMCQIRKRGMIVALVQIVLTIALFAIFLGIAFKAKAALFGTDVNKESSKRIADALNQPDAGITTVRVGLEENSAIIGFSSAAAEMRCYWCIDRLKSSSDSYYSIKRPQQTECINKSCLCSCTGIKSDIQVQRASLQRGPRIFSLSCTKMSCTSLSANLPGKTEIKDAIGENKNPTQSSTQSPYWEGGFFFVQSSSITNGLPTPKGPFAVTIQRKKVGDALMANACPPPADPSKPMNCIQQN